MKERDSLEKTICILEPHLRILGDQVRRFTVVIGYEGDGGRIPIGSGTFVTRTDGLCGILTAGHVLGEIKNKENILVLTAQDLEQTFWTLIEGQGMYGWGEKNTGENGPDIGWIPLSAEEAVQIEARGGVFYNRSKIRNDFCNEPHFLFSIILGFVNETSSLSNNLVVAQGMLIGEPEERWNDDEGWDYEEYAIERDDDWIPQTHKGLSGSAVWEIALSMDGERAVKLKGVVYAEGPQEDRKLIAHGEKSVRTILEDE